MKRSLWLARRFKGVFPTDLNAHRRGLLRSRADSPMGPVCPTHIVMKPQWQSEVPPSRASVAASTGVVTDPVRGSPVSEACQSSGPTGGRRLDSQERRLTLVRPLWYSSWVGAPPAQLNRCGGGPQVVGPQSGPLPLRTAGPVPAHHRLVATAADGRRRLDASTVKFNRCGLRRRRPDSLARTAR